MPTFEYVYEVTLQTDAPDIDTGRMLVERDLDEVALDYRFVKGC